MVKKAVIQVRDTMIRTLQENGIDYICITDIARQKNPVEPKDVVKNWMRVKNTLEYLGLWEKLNNLNFKGVEFDPLKIEIIQFLPQTKIFQSILYPHPILHHIFRFNWVLLTSNIRDTDVVYSIFL